MCPYSEFFWSECEKTRTRKTPNTDTFCAVIKSKYLFIIYLFILYLKVDKHQMQLCTLKK